MISIALLVYKNISQNRLNSEAVEINEMLNVRLVNLTDAMRSASEKSKVEFSEWAEVNDLILEYITGYYNSQGKITLLMYNKTLSRLEPIERGLDVAYEESNPEKQLAVLNKIGEMIQGYKSTDERKN